MKIPDFETAMAQRKPDFVLEIPGREPQKLFLIEPDTVLGTLARQKIAPETFETREAVPIPYLSEARRLELMILPRLMHRILEPDINGGTSAPEHPTVARVKRLFADAMVEPIAGLPIPVAEKLLERMNKWQMRIFREGFDQKTRRIKQAAIIWHAVRIMLDDGTLELAEGSAMAEGLVEMLPMFEDVLDDPTQDKSAQKQAVKFLSYLRKQGLYR